MSTICSFMQQCLNRLEFLTSLASCFLCSCTVSYYWFTSVIFIRPHFLTILSNVCNILTHLQSKAIINMDSILQENDSKLAFKQHLNKQAAFHCTKWTDVNRATTVTFLEFIYFITLKSKDQRLDLKK